MRAKTYVFVCEQHEEYGENGWKPKGDDNADPLSGNAVAHDIMEHTPNKHASKFDVDDEFMALGAMFYVRQYTDNYHSLGVNASADFRHIMEHVYGGEMQLNDPGRTYSIGAWESEIDEAIEHYKIELSGEGDSSEFTTEDARRIRGWMRRGYRMAAKRWAGVYSPRSIFDEIKRDADKWLKHSEEGAELHVTLTFRRNGERRSVGVNTNWIEHSESESYL